jgi:hypothetical protein
MVCCPVLFQSPATGVSVPRPKKKLTTGSAAFTVKVGEDLVTSPANGWSDTVDISDVAASFDGETVAIEEMLTDIAITDCLNPTIELQAPDPSAPLVVGEELILDVVNTVTCEAPEPPMPRSVNRPWGSASLDGRRRGRRLIDS